MTAVLDAETREPVGESRPFRRLRPLAYALWWLAGTYVLFLIIGRVDEVTNLDQVTLYIGATLACLTVGYRAGAGAGRPTKVAKAPTLERVNRLVVIGGLYHAVYGVTYLRQQGLRSPSEIVSAISSPGSAYLDKFAVYTQQMDAGVTDPMAQATTLLAVLGTPLVPLGVIYFGKLTPAAKVIGLTGLAIYAACFLGTGTLVGLGNILIFALAGFMIRSERTRKISTPRRRRAGLLVGVMVLGFFAYMAYVQGQRVEEVGIQERWPANEVALSVTGSDSFARGVTLVGFYPTHGYQGLSYSLQRPFEWTGGRGASRALDSYVAQYGLAPSVADRTYPARTEAATGWSAGIYWQTIYPWLASDLTFAGAALFMGIVGWWMARLWREAVKAQSVTATLLFAQLWLLIAFVPANNQIGLSRPNLIAFACLVGLHVIRPKRTLESQGGPKLAVSPTIHPT